MKPYIVLARKWRPQQFLDIVGQDPIVHTLSNAVRSQRLHQAYLFTGSRGVGKTSIARILAKVIRCEFKQEIKGSIQSCDRCQNCKEITTSSNLDVLEIDGASNNGVDSVREIREGAQYVPAQGNKKIYIIDEVHMLSTAAFNALLKILEEPPAHVIFIFATTEPHKIPGTILSRCQRFDYKRVPLLQIQARLEQIVAAEGLKAEASALALIARAAEGSMRDALSLLDQVIAYTGVSAENPHLQITHQATQESLGTIGEETTIQILNGIFQRKPSLALAQVESAYQQGHDFRLLARSLMELIHVAILMKIQAPLSPSIQISQEGQKEITAFLHFRSLEEMEFIFQVFHQGLDWLSRSPQPKIIFDILCIKCASAEILKYIEQASPSPEQSTNPKEENPKKHLAKAEQSFHWEGFIQHIRTERPLLGSILEHANAVDFQNQIMTLFFTAEEAYFKEQIQSRIYQEQLQILSKNYFGKNIRIVVETKTQGESLVAKKEKEYQEKLLSLKQEAETHPMIQEAKALFGGTLGPIELKGSQSSSDPGDVHAR